jgi:16S rRNA (guanine966-N2)-methyltransferase
MRIIAGKLKGRTIGVPPGDDIRPTSDRARQAIFNILQHKIHRDLSNDFLTGVKALDMFCGSGALGLEALSRGAAEAMFVDIDTSFARQNAQNMKVAGDCNFLNVDVRQLPGGNGKYNLVFLDPPYKEDLLGVALQNLKDKNWLADGAILITELSRNGKVDAIEGFEAIDERAYGAAKIILWRFSS